MKKTKITLPLTRLSDAELEVRTFGIIAAMTGNEQFPEPSPALADLSNSLKLFSDALALSQTKDKVKVAIKNKHRSNLAFQLTKLASYVQFIAQGDRATLSSSGFSLTAETSASKALAQPSNFTVEVGSTSGTALAYINAVANAKAYLFRWGVAPIVNDHWSNAIHLKPWSTITGLVPGTTYSFQIAVAGSKGQAVPTDIITKMVV
ncbi:MAG: hypothetical protein ABIQ88_17200 [Chitinophagaceae bacterium]